MQGESNTTNETGEPVPEAEAIVDQGEAKGASKESTEGAGSSRPAVDPLAEAQAEAGRMKDAWLRTAADFDNFRKRTRRELDDARRSGREDLLKAVLPVFDNLERAIQSAARATDIKSLVEGIAMVQRQFVDVLGREGIARVPTVGHPFDPTVHEAIQQVETTDHAPGTVLAEVQPGYTQADRLIRAAMVVVAKSKSGDGTEPEKPAAS
jgi:molecular chaperone GrpE